jgi:HAD superfamily hydrolase (TIGR01549 family)
LNLKHIAFDLDGTLVNSHNTIYKAAVRTLEHLNIRGKILEEEFYGRIGHHFMDIFKDMDISVPDFEHFINIYKSYYFDFIDTSSLYNGVDEVLDHIKSKNIPISLLTTKAQDQAEKILDHFNLTGYFSFIMGRRPGIKIKPDAEPLLFICTELNIDPADTIMVGDSDLDINCGKNAGALTCAVTYGYRAPELLRQLRPDFVIDRLPELKKIVDGEN